MQGGSIEMLQGRCGQHTYDCKRGTVRDHVTQDFLFTIRMKSRIPDLKSKHRINWIGYSVERLHAWDH